MSTSRVHKLTPQDRELLRLLRKAPRHSHDLRREFSMGDPSRRVSDLRALGYDIEAKQARRGRRHGVLYRLVAGPATELGGVGRRSPAPGAVGSSELGGGLEFVLDFRGPRLRVREQRPGEWEVIRRLDDGMELLAPAEVEDAQVAVAA